MNCIVPSALLLLSCSAFGIRRAATAHLSCPPDNRLQNAMGFAVQTLFCEPWLQLKSVSCAQMPSHGLAFPSSVPGKRPFYATQEDLYGAIAEYYDIPVLSFRTATYRLAGNQQQRIARIVFLPSSPCSILMIASVSKILSGQNWAF